MRPVHLSVVLSTALLAGCGTFVGSTFINNPPHDLIPRSPESVEVLSSGPPSRPHVDVALVEVEQTHSLNEQGTGLMIRSMREKAAALGCDAIVLGGVTDHQGAEPGSGWDLLDPGSTKRQATCIVYNDPPRPHQGSLTPAPPVTASPPPPAAGPGPEPTTQRHDYEDPSGRRGSHP